MSSRAAGLAAIGYGVLSLVAAVTQAVLVDFAVATPADLLHDVARSRVAWVGAQVVLIGQQELLVIAVIGLVAVLGRPRPATVFAVAQLAVAAVLFIASGVFHGVLGVHIATFDRMPGAARGDVVRLAETVHALGDTSYFLGIAATAFAMVALRPAIRGSSRLPDGLATLGLVAAVAALAEFGWFLWPGFGFAAPVGVILQAAWFAWLGRCLLTDAGRRPAQS